jgi:hypothetical protein
VAVAAEQAVGLELLATSGSSRFGWKIGSSIISSGEMVVYMRVR